MSDFISTCAEYIKDEIVRTTLAVIENSEPYPYAWESDSARSLARQFVTPRGARKPDRQFLRDIWEREEAAILAADEVYVLGWSIPRTDTEQECLIRHCVGKRSRPFQQVTVVNLSAGVDYYSRVQGIFGVERKAVRTHNTGFCRFAAAK